MRMNKRLILLLVVAMLLFAVSPVLAVEEGGGPLDALGINAGFLIAQIINFGLLFGGLTLFLWKPVTNMLDARAEKINKGLEDATAAANARKNAEAEAEKILAQARTEAAQVVENARGQGDEVAKTIEADARKDAEKIRAEARASAETERNQQLAEVRDQVKEISIAIAERLIVENMDKKKQGELIDRFFTDLPEGAKALTGDVTVVSAMPLDDAEQKKVTDGLKADNVTFVVNPNILGGLILRAGDRVVDGSVRNNMSDLASRLV